MVAEAIELETHGNEELFTISITISITITISDTITNSITIITIILQSNG